MNNAVEMATCNKKMEPKKATHVPHNICPFKAKDPKGFNIPCTISNVCISHFLCYLGASVNVMLLLLFSLMLMH